MKFQPGQSGNPAGRPKGIIDKRWALRKRLDDASETLVDEAIKRAIEGDSGLMRALLGRLIPPAKPESATVEFDLPETRLSEQAEAVLRAISSGAMSPTVGSDLLQSLAQAARIRETDELEERISRLEGHP